jgi:hypothetical protein
VFPFLSAEPPGASVSLPIVRLSGATREARPSGTQEKSSKVVSNFFLAVWRQGAAAKTRATSRHCGGSALKKGNNMTASKPALIAYGVRERDKGRKPIWTKVGTVWSHGKNGGFNVELEALPINFDGRLVLLSPKAEADADEGGDQ